MWIVWEMLVGLGLFLYGMTQLEEGIRGLGHATFKRLLTSSTNSPLSSAGVGAGVAAILQSSSMVSLLVLAFASAGVLPLYNAIGIVLGANLGTTTTGWIVATLGFKLSLQAFAVPLMGLGALSQLLPSKLGNIRAGGLSGFGLGLIIFGLDIMKAGVSDLPQQWDVSALQGYGPPLYFLFGALLAGLIQSSSAVMMITLAALHSNILTLSAAAAVVIGADLGTTSTTILGSIGESVIKRQLALAHFVFNVIVDVTALFLLLPALGQLQEWLSVSDPLYSLVLFHTSFNLLGLMVFLPLLRPYSDWVAARFVDEAVVERPLLAMPLGVPEAAISAIGRELEHLRDSVVILDMHNFHISVDSLTKITNIRERLANVLKTRMDFDSQYENIKRQEADILALALAMQEEPLTSEQANTLLRYLDTTRALVYSAKTLKDIRENLVEMRHSDNDAIGALFSAHQALIQEQLIGHLKFSLTESPAPGRAEWLEELALRNRDHYQAANESVHDIAAAGNHGGMEMSTLLNVNHEIHHALKTLQRTFPHPV